MIKKTKEEFLAEYTSKYIQMVPEYLRSHDDFLVFFALLCHEFNITELNINSFSDIINPDKVPKQFLESLGYFMNYHYQDRASIDFNRELLMRNRKLYEDRGSEKSIIMAATHGSNEGYLGGDIFIPGYSISKDIAELSVARDRIFIHSKSKLSSTSVYADGASFLPGVIVLSMPYLDNSVRAKLWEVIPAGIRLRYNIVISFTPNEQDPEDIYNFIPPYGVPKDEYGNLTYKPYIRVVPIVSKGDDFNSIENPIDFEYIINMSVMPTSDILVFSDKTLSKSSYFDENGLYKPIYDKYGNIIYKVPLLHGRRIHSGTKTIMEDYDYESSLGVSALPLSLVRRPFDLSSLPEKYTVTEREETIIVPDNPDDTTPSVIPDVSDETYTFEHYLDSVPKSKFSGNAFISGNLEKKETAPEQSYDNTTHTETIKVKDYNFYRITTTGEYEDRIDKKTADSVTRNLTVSMSLDYKSQKYHRVRHRSMRSGRHSGSLKSESLKILKDLLVNGVSVDDYNVIPFISTLDTTIQEDFGKLLNDETVSVGSEVLYGLFYCIESTIESENDYNEAQINYQNYEIIYNSVRDSSLEKQTSYQEMIRLRGIMYDADVSISTHKEQYEHTKNYIVSTYFTDINGVVVEDGKVFLNILDYYTDNNYLFAGIYVPGYMFEYVPIMTMQPSDVLYPISEVLDKKPIENRPGYLDTWDGNPETESTYGLKPLGENRNPFFQYQDIVREYEPANRDGSILSASPIVVGDNFEISYSPDLYGDLSDVGVNLDVKLRRNPSNFSPVFGLSDVERSYIYKLSGNVTT